jgi:hypothetical protein
MLAMASNGNPLGRVDGKVFRALVDELTVELGGSLPPTKRLLVEQLERLKVRTKLDDVRATNAMLKVAKALGPTIGMHAGRALSTLRRNHPVRQAAGHIRRKRDIGAFIGVAEAGGSSFTLTGLADRPRTMCVVFRNRLHGVGVTLRQQGSGGAAGPGALCGRRGRAARSKRGIH